MALFILRKFILQSRMHSHPVGLDVWFLVGPLSTSLFYLCQQWRLWRAAQMRSLAWAFAGRLCDKNTIISWDGSFLIKSLLGRFSEWTFWSDVSLLLCMYSAGIFPRGPNWRSVTERIHSRQTWWYRRRQSKTIWAATWQNQQNYLCAQRRLRSAWASAQFDQSLRCPYEETVGP